MLFYISFTFHQCLLLTCHLLVFSAFSQHRFPWIMVMPGQLIMGAPPNVILMLILIMAYSSSSYTLTCTMTFTRNIFTIIFLWSHSFCASVFPHPRTCSPCLPCSKSLSLSLHLFFSSFLSLTLSLPLWVDGEWVGRVWLREFKHEWFLAHHYWIYLKSDLCCLWVSKKNLKTDLKAWPCISSV